MTTSAQIGIEQTIILSQADIQTLYSVGKIIVPAESNFANIFNKATLFYTYQNTVFSGVDNLMAFYYVPSVGDPILISNSLNATNIIGIPQRTITSFNAADPYPCVMADSGNCSIMLKMLGADPTGGDTRSTLSVKIEYDVLQLS